MSDLDDEELEATRRLNGLGKIEDKMGLKEAKRQLIELKRDRQSFLKGDIDYDEVFLKDIEAIDTVLQELEKYEKQIDLEYVEKNYISKDKIRAKIEEYEKDKEKFRNYMQVAHKKDENIRYINDLRFGLNIVISSIRALQELLEEGGNDEND